MRTPIERLSWPAQAAVLAFSALAIVACEKRLDNAHAPKQQVASSSAVLIGTTPAGPTTPAGAPPETTPLPADRQLTSEPKLTETPQTTGSAEASKEMTKAEESRSMPLPGQPNDHSNLAADGSQRAGQSDPQSQPPRAEPQSDSPQRQNPPKS